MRLTRWAAAAGCAALVLAGAGCSSRSPEAFCEELNTGNAKMQANYESSKGNDLANLGSIFINAGEFTTMLHHMQDKAPEEISSDLDDAVEVWDRQAEAMGDVVKNPLGALASQLTASMMASASMRNVDLYAKEHCGLSVFGVAGTAAADTPAAGSSEQPSPSTQSTGAAVAVPDGDLAAPGLTSGSLLEASEGGGSVALQARVEVAPATPPATAPADDGPLVVSVFDSATMAKQMTYQVQDDGCYWGIGPGPNGTAVLVAQESEKTPAAGLQEEVWAQFLAAYDATTGTQLWRTQWKEPDDSQADAGGCDWPGSGDTTFSFTEDGSAVTNGQSVFTLRDGKFRYMEDLGGTVGNYLYAEDPDDSDLLRVLDPVTGKKVGSLPDRLESWVDAPSDSAATAPTWQEGSETVVAAGTPKGMGAFAVPSGRKVWDQPYDWGEVSGYSRSAGVLVVGGVGVGPGGRRLWQEQFRPCLVDNGTVVGEGATLVQLDVSTGKQLDYVDSAADCQLPANRFSRGVLWPADGYVDVIIGDIWSIMNSGTDN